MTLDAHLDAGETLLASVLASRWDSPRLDELQRLGAKTPVEAWRSALRRHGLAGVVVKNHGAALGRIPDEHAAVPRELHRLHVPRALGQLKVLVDASSALQAAGVACVPFKGISLSWELYRDITVRESVDVDILVDPRDIDQALAALCEGAGFTPTFDYRGSPGFRELMLESGHHLDFVAPGGQHCELHWRSDPSPACSLPPLGQIVESLKVVRHGPVSLPTLGDDLLLRAVATHAARSRCRYWRWGYDVIELSSRRAGSDAWPPEPLPSRHANLSLDTMALQLGLPSLDLPRREARTARLLSRQGSLHRRARVDPAGLSRWEGIVSQACLYAALWRLEESTADALRRLRRYGMGYFPERNPGRARLVVRFPFLAPWLKLWEAVRQE